MFYSSNSRVEHDYYNTYSTPRGAASNQSILNTMIKILVILFLITLIIAGYIFITKEHGVTENPQPRQTVVYEVKEEPLVEEVARGIAVPGIKTERSLSTEEITQIVQIVMMQLNNAEKKKSPEKEIPLQKNIVVQDDDSFVKSLMSIELGDDVLNQESDKNKLALKDMNHYNKVVVQSDNRMQEATGNSLTQLSNEISNLIGVESDQTGYTQSIAKEIRVRSNEMRVIVVQKGDTLSKIAHRAYGNYDAYPKIFAANPEVIHNPDQIFVGQKLRIPL